MDDLQWRIPNIERVVDRLEEIDEYLQNFPGSALAPILKNESDELNQLLSVYG